MLLSRHLIYEYSFNARAHEWMKSLVVASFRIVFPAEIKEFIRWGERGRSLFESMPHMDRIARRHGSKIQMLDLIARVIAAPFMDDIILIGFYLSFLDASSRATSFN